MVLGDSVLSTASMDTLNGLGGGNAGVMRALAIPSVAAVARWPSVASKSAYMYGYGGLITTSFNGSDSVTSQMYISHRGELGFRMRWGEDSTWGEAWSAAWTSRNTTVDTNGFIKSASPVVKLFHDGRAEINDESEGCAVQRLDVGQYLITGCIGLNADAAWGGISGGFDIPKDRNGQPVIWLDFEVNQDGSVLVKTYHRTYPNAPAFAQNIIKGIADGEPVDIPADQFVSVRVEMPEDSVWHQRMSVTHSEEVSQE